MVKKRFISQKLDYPSPPKHNEASQKVFSLHGTSDVLHH